MKKPVAMLSTALIVGSLLAGCGATNAGNGTNTPMQNVGYRNNQVNPNTPSNINNYNNNTAMQNVTFDNQTAKQIADQVNNINGVTYASTLINGNTVYVGVTTTPQVTNKQQLDEQVRNVVQKYVGNRNVQVVTDRNMVNRMSNLSTRLANGNAPARGLNTDVRAIFNDLGNTMQRPLQNTAR